jgi:hypothetical protein
MSPVLRKKSPTGRRTSTSDMICIDVLANFDVSENVAVSGGINNLFAKAPPFFAGSFAFGFMSPRRRNPLSLIRL